MLACKSNVFFGTDITYYLAQYNPSNLNDGYSDEDIEDCFICFVPYSLIVKEFGSFEEDDYTKEEIKEDITVMCEVDYNPLAKNPTCYNFRGNVCEEYYNYPENSKGTNFETYFEIEDERVFKTDDFIFD
ncbi:MAG: hypothetical protein AAF847_00160 [Bacteroidota bacterium]